MLSEKLANLSLSPREKIGAVIAVLLIIAALTYYLVARPVWNWLEAVGQHIRVAEKQMTVNQRILAPPIRETAEREYQRYDGYMVKKGSTAEENAQMLGAIEELASQAGITLGNTKPRDVRSLELAEEYAVEIEVECGLANFIRLLYSLQESPQLLRVDKMTVGPKGRGDAAEVKATLLVSKELFL
jgi:hypothetical protein